MSTASKYSLCHHCDINYDCSCYYLITLLLLVVIIIIEEKPTGSDHVDSPVSTATGSKPPELDKATFDKGDRGESSGIICIKC